ncbi:transcriptional repressor [Candidatus Micrarchaeota archaeon CG10_big_fil_rev_8_21_14_0_10_45_29]|nr:MAG: transcriptional repressor [Candidatus Micrarchaeota archaeon CG10_big_fil_rev_8_21_14_0_10_45_29]
MITINERLTPQKIKIIEFLKGTTSHPTAEDVYKNVKKSIPCISLGTVYRNLGQMAQRGQIRRLEVEGGFRYDADLSSHLHLVCKKCGSISDMHDVRIFDFIKKKTNPGKFIAQGAEVTIFGICKNCKK